MQIRGVAGRKTMCNQRTSARGMGAAEGPYRVQGGQSPPEGQRF